MLGHAARALLAHAVHTLLPSAARCCRLRIQPGAASVEVEDWDTGELVAIKLDPEKTAVAFAEGLYKQVQLTAAVG